MWRLAIIAAVVLTASCELFGLGVIHCRSDAFCPTGYSCHANVCIVTEDVFGNPLDASGLWDAAGPIENPCATPGCSRMPDSSTTACFRGDTGDAIACPRAGEEFYGQDGNYLINTPSFQTHGTLVEDLVTGLWWDKAAPSDHRADSWTAALAYCSGRSDENRSWRLPTLREMISIMDFGSTTPAVNTGFQPPAANGAHWTATQDAEHAATHWAVNLSYAGELKLDDATEAMVICVSGDARDSSAIEATGGRFVDAATGLTWRTDYNTGISWADALSYCEGLSNSDGTDWRLPTIKELETLVDHSAPNGVATYRALQASTMAENYWSSTPHSLGQGMWAISFGGTGWANPISNYGRLAARCVRGR